MVSLKSIRVDWDLDDLLGILGNLTVLSVQIFENLNT
jgi:hypothetical protein